MINFDKIVDGIFVGSCPTNQIDIRRLKQIGFTAVLSLQSDSDHKILGINWNQNETQYHQFEIASYRVPIIDFNDADLIANLPLASQTLKMLIEHNHRIYVHCTAGQQRAPSTVIAHLAWNEGLGLDKALEHVLSKRNCAPPVSALEAADAIYQQNAQNNAP